MSFPKTPNLQLSQYLPGKLDFSGCEEKCSANPSSPVAHAQYIFVITRQPYYS